MPMKSFFILGVERSGTTLLRLIMDAHSQIAIPFETMVLIDFALKVKQDYNNLTTHFDRERLARDLLATRCFRMWNPRVQFKDIDLNNCHGFGDIVDSIFSVYAEKQGKCIWGEKSPTYESHLFLLNKLFPESKFINLIRDGRDVVQSLMKQQWGPNSFMPAFNRWIRLVESSRKMGLMLPSERYIEVRYEDIVQDPETTVQNICCFLEVPYEKEMLSKFNKDLSKKLPKTSMKYHKNLEKTFNNDLVYKWEQTMSFVDQTIAYAIAGDLFDELGYPTGYIKTSGKLVFLRKLYWLFHEALIWRVKQRKQSISLKTYNYNEKNKY